MIDSESHAQLLIVEPDSLSKEDVTELARYFRESVFPVLTPLALDPGHPFLLVSESSLYLAVLVRHPLSGRENIACLGIPSLLPPLVGLPDGQRFVPLERVVATNLRTLFPGMEIVDHAPFRLTSGGADERGEARGARLEVDRNMAGRMRNLLVRHLRLSPG